MCLNLVTKRYNPPDPAERTAYKIVRESKYHGKTELEGPFMSTIYLMDQWIYPTQHYIYANYPAPSPSDVEIVENVNARYRSGFHVFPTREDAMRCYQRMSLGFAETLLIVEVRVKDITSEGEDGTFGRSIGANNLVASALYISRESYLQARYLSK
jgi:hypothetical protein